MTVFFPGTGTASNDLQASVRLKPSDNTTNGPESVTDHVTPESSQLSKNKKKKKKKKSSGSSTGDPSSSPTSSPASTISAASSSAAGQTSSSPQSNFQQELEWCVAQLQIGLSRRDTTKSQTQENEKYIRNLRSEKTPLPRKRQIMKNLFGDYRTRMVREPVPRYQETSESVPRISCGRSLAESGGKFFRRSVQSDHKLSRVEGVNGEGISENGVNCESELKGTSGTNFCFNFEVQP